jgi:SOS response regulatory protein OraA/RecX
VLKAGMAFLRMKARRKKGVRVFRRQLKHSGLSKEQIKGLVADYEQKGRLRSYLPGDLRGFRFMRS